VNECLLLVARQQPAHQWSRWLQVTWLVLCRSPLRPLLCERSVNGPQQWGKWCFLCGSVRRLYNATLMIFETVRSPCGGGFEYLHRSPASRRRQRKEKTRIWDNKIWSRVPRDSDLRMTTLERPPAIVNDRPDLSSERAPDINKDATVWKQ
jgi:hypothetical protein